MPIQVDVPGHGIVEFPDGMSDDQISAAIRQNMQPEPSRIAQVGGGIRDLLAGGVRGAGSIGATLLAPVDIASDYMAGKGISLESNRARREAIDTGLRDLVGANTESALYQGGKLAGEVAGTAGAGGAVGNMVGRVAPRLGAAIGSAGFDIGGQAAKTIPQAIQNAALRVGGGAITGGTAAGMINPEDAGTGAAIGGAFGAAAPAIGKVGSKIAQRLSKPTAAETAIGVESAADDALKSLADDAGVSVKELPTDTVNFIKQEAAKAFQRGEKLDAAALIREREFQQLGIKPLQGQITRDPTQYAQELNMRGGNQDIANRLREQNQAMQRIFGEPAQSAQEAVPAGRGIIESLGKYDEAKRGEISSLYKAARESAGKDLEIPLQGMAQDVADVIDNFGDKVPSGVLNQFKKYGLLGEKQTKLFTVEEADRLMKVINSNASNDPATNAALSRLRDSVRTSVESVDASGGVFAPAVRAARQRFSELDAIPALKSVAQGKASPDTFVRNFVTGGKTDEVKRMADMLRNTAPEQFNQAKAQVAEDIRRAAFGEGITADASLRPEMLAKKLREIGTEKLGAFFSPEEIDRYQIATKVANYIGKHPNAAPVNTSNTFVAQLMSSPAVRGAGKAIEMIPGGGIVSGVAKAATGTVKNEMAAAQAMKAKIPVEKLDLSESQRRLLAKILGATGAATSGQLAQ